MEGCDAADVLDPFEMLDTDTWCHFAANLYPPFYGELRAIAQPSAMVTLRNEERPPVWEQVSDWIDRNGALANSDLCRIAGVDTLRASKMLKRWVEQGVLQRDDSGGKHHTVYLKPVPDAGTDGDAPLSLAPDNGGELDQKG